MSTNIAESVRAEVGRRLRAIELEERVRVVFACESGSRAWGFASTDSDYDVRFIYVRPIDWYLTIDVELNSDVIERPIETDMDLSGWDLRKALQLMRKSNPPLLEWLGSPIVYCATEPFTMELRALSKPCYSPRACLYHYLSMARSNVREYLKGDEVWRKKYLYVLRPLLAIRWIEQLEDMPPTEFSHLVEATLDDVLIKTAINDLIEAKRLGHEMDRGPAIPVLSEFIRSELDRHDRQQPTVPPARPAFEPLNRFFRAIVTTLGGQ